jgi:phage shock protein A
MSDIIVVNGTEYPHRVLKEIIGELYIELDNLRHIKNQQIAQISTLRARIAELEAEREKWQTGQLQP